MGAIFQSLGRTIVAGLLILAVILAVAGTFDSMGERFYWMFFTRWLHVLSGVLWIGLLWYFNFVQIPSMPKIPDEQKPAISKVIAPTALFWFRWSALATVVTGLTLAALSGYLVQALSGQGDRHRHVAGAADGVQRVVHHLAEPEEGAGHGPGRARSQGQGGAHGDADFALQHHAFDPDALPDGGTAEWWPLSSSGISSGKKTRPGFPAVFHLMERVAAYFRFEATKSQFTRLQNASMYFGRALR